MESKIPKMAVCRVKVRYIRLSPTINIQHGHIHKIFEIVFRRINYGKNTIQMNLFQKYEVFIKKQVIILDFAL